MKEISIFLLVLAFSLTCLQISYGDIREELGLVALWTFDEGTVTDKVVDDVFGENTANITGKPVVVKGFLSNAMDFDGIVDCAKIINDIFFPSISIEAIIKPALARRSPIYDKYNYGIQMEVSDQVGIWIRADTEDTNKQWISAYTPFPKDGQWHHVVGVAEDTKNVRIYLDGKLKTTTPAPDSISVAYGSTVKPSIAYTQHLNGIWYQGSIDEVAVYEGALTDSDVNKLYVNSFAVEYAGKLPTIWGKIKDD